MQCLDESCSPHVNFFIEVNGTAPMKNTHRTGRQAERHASDNKVLSKMLYHCHKLSQLNSTV